jgi:hypothetical protein
MMMEQKQHQQFSCLSNSTIDNVVFEKVKIKAPSSTSASLSSRYNYNELMSSFIHVTNNDDDRNDDSNLTTSTFIGGTSYEADDEDDIQWKHFLELRKHGRTTIHASNSNNNENNSLLNDSGFGSQLFSTSNNINNSFNNHGHVRAVFDTWHDEETYDNSFNEELEQRVSIMFPELHKSSSQNVHFNNINNTNHMTAQKLS